MTRENDPQECGTDCTGCLYCAAFQYSIVRFYQRGGSRRIRTGLSLKQAHAHCNDPETSSSTCTTAAARRITRRNGAWFDGYTDR